VTRSPSRGEARHFTVKAGDRTAVDAALRYADSPVAELRDLVRLDWAAMDGWFEEDEEVYTHPRDPYTRVDTEDRRAGLLLQRGGRSVHRRPAPGAAGHQVQQRPQGAVAP
jgi:hypothetical protein